MVKSFYITGGTYRSRSQATKRVQRTALVLRPAGTNTHRVGSVGRKAAETGAFGVGIRGACKDWQDYSNTSLSAKSWVGKGCPY